MRLSYDAPKPPKDGSKTQNGRFSCKIALRLKELCYKVTLCENCQRHSCKPFIVLSIRAKMIGGDVPLNVNFALREPSLWRGALAVLISAYRKFDEYSIWIAVITMEYEITNNVH